MITLAINNYQNPMLFRSVTEQEAMTHICSLHDEIIQSKKRARGLEGLLCTGSYRNTEGSKLARFRDEKREWQTIRRLATQSRLLLQCG
ncbi:hypothetical protein [Candidatus Magnetaquicoccus inordinatus]|uniref:hypothetical protein n=1 Tax=Candidatus Magnetaquicoccus inordinatus TaxID=2496818 RepID=UPI00102B9956|nr:hypothetical protein [Candidatus Magnetaquicoccus inordinatus]